MTIKQEPTALQVLCAGVLPHIAMRIRRAYWIGAAHGLQHDRREPNPSIVLANQRKSHAKYIRDLDSGDID